MSGFMFLIKNFFTHKDFLPPADTIPGTLFTPLHFIFSAVLLTLIIFGAIALSSKSEKLIRIVFMIIWTATVCLEIVKIIWETCSGQTVNLELSGILPLYPCSIFMYAMPLAIWGKRYVRYMGCGYVCTLGLLGGIVNFFYPANILSNYSCISFAGLHTFLYHGAILFCALVMLKSGYHSYKNASKAWELLLPAVPMFAVSIAANIVNFSKINSDYMFFKLESFFFAPLGAALPDGLGVLIVYGLYMVIHTLPYIPFYITNKKQLCT